MGENFLSPFRVGVEREIFKPKSQRTTFRMAKPAEEAKGKTW